MTTQENNSFNASINDLRKDLKHHMEMEEIVQKNQLELLKAIKEDVKESRDMIQDNKSYFDGRITQHYNDFQILLKDNYMTKAEISAMREKTVNVHVENRHKEIKKAKEEAVKVCEEKDKAVYSQISQLKGLLYGGLIFFTGVITSVFMYFKSSGQP